MANSASGNPTGVFTCWKEIASYLGKGVRTVQRWENQFGLPVQRPNSKSKGTVRASRQELDVWLHNRWSSRSPHTWAAVQLSASENIKTSRRLREEQRRRMSELRKSLIALGDQCKQWRVS